MKRFIVFGLLTACSDPSSPPTPCQPNTCAEFHHERAPVCGLVYDGCGKDIDCGPCDLSDLGGGGASSSASTAETTNSSTSSGEVLGEGGANMCQDLTFDK